MAEKKYLDLDGLGQFWGLIKEKFVTGTSLSVGAEGATLTYTVNGESKDAGSIGIASKDSAAPGLMTQAQAAVIADFSAGVEALVPLTDVQINGTSALDADSRAVNIDLKYDSTAKQIQIINKKNEDAVLTSIDAKEFIKDGMLSSAKLVSGKYNVDGTEKEGTFIELKWNTDSGVADPMYIDVTTLIDTYTATADGGLSVADKAFSIKCGDLYLATDAEGLKVTRALWQNVDGKDVATLDVAKDYTDSKLDTAKTELRGYADNAVSNALTEAKTYTDGEIDKIEAVIGAASVKDDKGAVTSAATGLHAVIEAGDAASIAYIDDVKALLDGDIAVAKTGAISEAKTYTDSAIADLETSFVAITENEIDAICV